MTQEEKQLLLKDLCARLPYNVICKLSVKDVNVSITVQLDLGGLEHFIVGTMDVLPYLRPMSSMTDEEKKKLKEISDEYLDQWMSANDPSVRWKLDANNSSKRAEFYNSHYLDWNGLIEKSLALEAPADMYKTS